MNQEAVKPILSDKAYQVAKQLALVILPAISTLYFTMSNIWGWPYAEEVIGTIAAVSLFIGSIAKISNTQHNNIVDGNAGEITILSDGGGAYIEDVDMAIDPDMAYNQNYVKMRVRH